MHPFVQSPVIITKIQFSLQMYKAIAIQKFKYKFQLFIQNTFLKKYKTSSSVRENIYICIYIYEYSIS